MNYEVENLIEQVKVAIDENTSSEALTGPESGHDIDQLKVDEIVRSKLEDAARVVSSAAPVHLIDNALSFRDNPIYWLDSSDCTTFAGFIKLPVSFMRLIAFKMSDWDRVVTAPITEEDEEYKYQRSHWSGVRGTPERPVCVIANRFLKKDSSNEFEQKQVLEFYACKSRSTSDGAGGETGGATISLAMCVTYPKIESVTTTATGSPVNVDKLDLSTRLLRPTVLEAASMTLLALGEGDAAQVLHAKAAELIK